MGPHDDTSLVVQLLNPESLGVAGQIRNFSLCEKLFTLTQTKHLLYLGRHILKRRKKGRTELGMPS